MAKAHAEAFQAWMIETRSPATAVDKRTGLLQFFKWRVEDEEDPKAAWMVPSILISPAAKCATNCSWHLAGFAHLLKTRDMLDFPLCGPPWHQCLVWPYLFFLSGLQIEFSPERLGKIGTNGVFSPENRSMRPQRGRRASIF